MPPSHTTPNHHKLPSFNQNSDQAIAGPSTPHQSNWHVAFDLTPTAPPVDLTPNQCDSLWLNSPSDTHPSSSDIFLPNNLPPDTLENFNYVFQSPWTPSRLLGSVQSWHQTFTTPQTPSYLTVTMAMNIAHIAQTKWLLNPLHLTPQVINVEMKHVMSSLSFQRKQIDRCASSVSKLLSLRKDTSYTYI